MLNRYGAAILGILLLCLLPQTGRAQEQPPAAATAADPTSAEVAAPTSAEAAAPTSAEAAAPIPKDRLRFRTNAEGVDAFILGPIDQPLQILGHLALPGDKAGAIRNGDLLYVGLAGVGIVIVDIRDPQKLLEIGRIPRERLAHTELFRGKLQAWSADGACLAYGLDSPQQPQYAGSCVRVQGVAIPGVQVVEQTEPVPTNPPIRRFYTRNSLLPSNIPGLSVDIGAEYNSASGVWLGTNVSISHTYFSVWIPGLSHRSLVGYSSKYAGVGVLVQGDFSYAPFGIYAAFRSGLALRLGRVDGTHVRFNILWPLFPLLVIPNGDLSIHGKIHPLLWLLFRGRGGIYPILEGTGEVGVEIVMKPGKVQTLMTASLGGGLFLGIPTGIAQIGYERRW